jgi:DNA repair protein RadA/Sms
MKCNYCTTDIPHGKLQCPVCKRFRVPEASIGTSDVMGSIKLSTIAAKGEERLISGPWDVCFGGGLAVTSANLLGGEPGGGKSTLSLQISYKLCEAYKKLKPDGYILYIATEEHSSEIKIRADRLKIPSSIQEHLYITDMMQSSFTIEELLDSVSNRPPMLMILDSLSGMVGRDIDYAVEIAKTAKIFSVKTNCPSLLIDHLNKEFALAGSMALQHAVDCTMGFVIDDTETGNEEIDEIDKRYLITLKNRFGPAKVKVWFEMTENGLEPLIARDEEDENEERARN